MHFLIISKLELDPPRKADSKLKIYILYSYLDRKQNNKQT